MLFYSFFGFVVTTEIVAVLVSEFKVDWCTGEIPGIAEIIFDVAAIAKVDEVWVGSKKGKGGRILAGLSGIIDFGQAAFEAGWRLLGGEFFEQTVEGASGDFRVAPAVNGGG